jgi:DNA-binding response OmpR family regulator
VIGGDNRSPVHPRSRILLLVSDPLVRSVMQEILEKQGFSVFPAGDLGKAEEWLEECSADLLITRTYISGMPGHDAAKYLRNKCPHMHVLMVGGLLADDRLQHRAALEGFEVFPKPYSAAELIEKVRSVLATVAEKHR